MPLSAPGGSRGHGTGDIQGQGYQGTVQQVGSVHGHGAPNAAVGAWAQRGQGAGIKGAAPARGHSRAQLSGSPMPLSCAVGTWGQGRQEQALREQRPCGVSPGQRRRKAPVSQVRKEQDPRMRAESIL